MLADELVAMATATFEEILQAPLPPMFAWLWEQCTEE